MKKKKKKEYLKILELSDNASRDDIENAYSHFVKLYSFGDSPEIHPLKDEIDNNERKKILADIDKAYKALVGEDAVNRMEFTAEFEPQEINLDEEESAVIDNKEISAIDKEEIIDHSEKDEEVPVVEFEEPDEPVADLTVEETGEDPVESGEQVVGMSGDKVPESKVPVELEIEIPVEEEGTLTDSEKNDEEPGVETQENEVDQNEAPSGIEIELPLEEDENEIIESEEPVVEVDGSEIPENELQIEFGQTLDEQVINESQSNFGEQSAEKEEIEEVTGKYLKRKREEMGQKVRDLAIDLGISYKDIVNIENEKFEKLADPGYLRWLIKAYAKKLGIDEGKSAEDYMRRYRQKK